MTDWRPIKCPACGVWHEQPAAHEMVSSCIYVLQYGGQKPMLEYHNRPMSGRERDLLAGFDKLSEKA